jgi:hypothetical protein
MENEKILKLLHDLNNNMCACSGFTEILIEAEDREYQKKLLTSALAGLIKMSKKLEDCRIDLLKDMEERSHLDSTS